MRAPRTLNPGVLTALVVAVLVALSGCGDRNFGELLFGGPGGICGLVVIILDVYAFVQIAQSRADGLARCSGRCSCSSSPSAASCSGTSSGRSANGTLPFRA